MSAEISASPPEVAAVAAFVAGEPDAGRRGMGAPRASVTAREVDHTFNPDPSAGLFTGVSTFFDAYGQPSTEIHAIDFAVDDAVDLAALFSLELKLIQPANVRLALSGTPKKPSPVEALARLLALGAKRYEARFITVLDLLDDVSRLTRADGILITSFATHGYSSGGRDHLLCQDSLLAQPQVSSLCVQDLLGRMQEPDSTRSKRRLLLIDACREFLKKSRGMKTEGLSDTFNKALEAAHGTVVLTGTVAGGFSYDDAQSQNGVFTSGVRQGLLGAAGSDERGFITPETLAVYLNERVASWVAQNRKGDREQSTGISKILDGACAQMPLAVHHEKWTEWRRLEDLKSKPTSAQIEAALARLDDEHPFFFGREKLVAQIVRTLKTSPIVTLTGRAGCGKTSLVRAGLVRAAGPGASQHPRRAAQGSHPDGMGRDLPGGLAGQRSRPAAGGHPFGARAALLPPHSSSAILRSSPSSSSASSTSSTPSAASTSTPSRTTRATPAAWPRSSS